MPCSAFAWHPGQYATLHVAQQASDDHNACGCSSGMDLSVWLDLDAAAWITLAVMKQSPSGRKIPFVCLLNVQLMSSCALPCASPQ